MTWQTEKNIHTPQVNNDRLKSGEPKPTPWVQLSFIFQNKWQIFDTCFQASYKLVRNILVFQRNRDAV